MPTETYTLVGLGVAAVAVIWLVFSVAKKLVGLLLLVALVAAAFIAWQNPELARQVTLGFLASR